MRLAFAGTLGHARQAARSGALAARAAEGFRAAYSRDAGEEELFTWGSTLPLVLDTACQAVPEQCGVLLEYGLPFNDQRIDLMLVGGNGGQPCAHVIELKNWEASRGSEEFAHFVEVAGGLRLHPSYQALNYGGKLKNLHSFGPSMSVAQSAVIVDGGPENHRSLFSTRYAELLARAPLYVAPDLDGLKTALRSSLPDPAKPEWLDEIMNGRYTQSAKLLESVRERQAALLKRSSEVLAATGWGLSKDQLQVLDEIMNAVEKKERAVFCVSGGPGSGKSLLAMHVFLGTVGLKQSAILAVRNSRLNEALRAILDRSVIGVGAQGMVKYFSTGNAGVEDDSSKVAEVLICDEGQRLALRSPNVLVRAPVVVILFDEAQILNQSERGTAENLFELCSRIGLEPRLRALPTPHRCRGGYAYLQFVEALLLDPGKAATVNRNWEKEYDFRIVTTPQQLTTQLRYKTGRVGLLASFTRASGRAEPKRVGDLGIVRVPETQPPIRWLMDPKKDYVPFYLEGKSNELDKCASIYGAQGFELDHVGLFWGSDLVIRNGRWTLGNPDECYDRAPGSPALATVMRDNPQLALALIRNRYRILLTRGIFGTAVYCEDPETRDYLSRTIGD